MISFSKEFLGRFPGDRQKDVLCAINGDKAGEWSTEFHEVALEIGMKGGKNWVLEIDAAFTMYFINCLRDPHAYFTKITKRLLPYTIDKTFDLINVSVVDENQARRAFFDSVKKAIKLSKDPKSGENWFEKFVGLDLREEFGDLKRKEIEFPTSQPGAGGIRVMSFNSEAAAPEGLHMLKFYADELSRADTKQKYLAASKLYDLGLNNTSVSFPGRVGKCIGWAYPNDTEFDLAHERYDKSFESDAIFGLRLSTFDFNPSVTRDHFNDRYKADPIKSKRVFECIKPVSKDNFYQPYVFKLDECITDSIFNKIKYKPTTLSRSVQSGEKYIFTGIEILGLKGDKRERCFAYDTGKTKDRFIIAGGYLETIDPKKMELFIGDELEVITTNKIPIIDVMIVITPKDGYPVDYVQAGSIFTTLLKHFPNSKSFNSDHYQNEKLRQEIIQAGVAAETYFFGNPQQVRLYSIKRAAVWNNNLIIAKDIEPAHKVMVGTQEHSIDELWLYEGRKLIKNGNKIDHPVGGTKDIQDAVAIVVNDLMKLEAQGVSGMVSGLEQLTDEKLRDLANQYIKAHYEFTEAEKPEDQVKSLLCEKFGLSEKDLSKLAKFVKDEYFYP